MRLLALMVTLIGCSTDRPVGSDADDAVVKVDRGSDAAPPDCGCLDERWRTVIIVDDSPDPAANNGPAGVDICGIEVRCGDRVLTGSQPVLEVGELYCSDCWGDEYFDPNQALDGGEECANPREVGVQPNFVTLGVGGALAIQSPDAGPCGLAGCQIIVREANRQEFAENLEFWRVMVCQGPEGTCRLPTIAQPHYAGTATVECCVCEP